MSIYSVEGIGYDSNVYVLPGENPTVIDTGTGLNPDYTLEGIKKHLDLTAIKYIVLTHEHYDHCGGVSILRDHIENAEILAHTKGVSKLQSGISSFAQLLGGEMPQINVDKPVSGGEVLRFGDTDFQVIYTPGHSPGCICFYDRENQILISGDTIFSGGSFGRYDLPGGDLTELQHSIEKLSELEIQGLYPGHGPHVKHNGKRHVLMSLRNIQTMG